ncbi:MAG: hypothetical protein LBV54_05280, partial [Puniceicoccales bacterium]|nr:hypothetical protein [Puniceicoccales bacterium]
MPAGTNENAGTARPDAVSVLLRAFDNNRFPHGIILHGPDAATLHDACAAIATRLLNTSGLAELPSHPDFHALRPTNKMRRINVDDIRNLVRLIQHSASAGGRKVAVIYDAERMVHESANAFLKTLEEPPEDSTLFLLTTKPTHLLDTIRSRCLQFYVPPGESKAPDPAWAAWLDSLGEWLESLAAPMERGRIATLVFSLYGMASRFEGLLKNAA